ncbi:MAG: XdhC family protein [Gemmatimonadaceae bacterium]|nr:XdhC family protein [Gemmatimonadaceae bacterium]
MSTHREIIDGLFRAADAGESVVLATVVRITGSSYGGVGSRMLICVDGTTVGLVSGGCLESDIAEHARRVNSTGAAEVVRYDTLDDDDAPWGLGLGCNGLIDILLEPLNAARARSVGDLLQRALEADEPSAIATVIHVIESDSNSPQIGAHALARDNSILTSGDWGSGFVLADASEGIADAIKAGRRGLVHDYNGVEIAFEVVNPSVHLLVCGSGPDAGPIARFGVELGWEVTVVDHRAGVAERASRFPGAIVTECLDALELADCVNLSSRTAAVVVSHHFERDRNYLNSLLRSEVTYIGMLGPRARTERMFTDLEAEPVPLHPDERVYSPVGMDIGGDGPDAIALAIVAEISAVSSRRSAGHLRDKRGPLHAAAPSVPTAGKA